MLLWCVHCLSTTGCEAFQVASRSVVRRCVSRLFPVASSNARKEEYCNRTHHWFSLVLIALFHIVVVKGDQVKHTGSNALTSTEFRSQPPQFPTIPRNHVFSPPPSAAPDSLWRSVAPDSHSPTPTHCETPSTSDAACLHCSPR